MQYAQVAVNLPVKNIFQLFTYKVPRELDFLAEGWRVVVPFGRQLLEGFVVGEDIQIDAELEYKAIVDVLGTEPWFDQEMLATARWMAQYYMCSLSEVLRLFIPGKRSIAAVGRYGAVPSYEGELSTWEEELYRLLQVQGPQLRQRIMQLDKGSAALKSLITKGAVALEYEITKKIKNKFVNSYSIAVDGQVALDIGNKRQKAQMAALALLQTGDATAADLAEQGVSGATLRTLVSKGYVNKKQVRVLRDSYQGRSSDKELLHLTQEQEDAVEAVHTCAEEHKYRTFLLQGITGSGKTEVYLRLTRQIVAAGKQVLVLVPEIALTGQIVQRFKAWFGNAIAVAHSKLSASERADVWERMRSHEASVLIGVRSAVFAPLPNLGLIVIDEEHEYTYKQDERPNYHARDVAQERARLVGIPVLLGSATPDIESYYKAQKGEYSYLQLTKRPMLGGKLPQVDIVDMRRELQQGNRSVLSRQLQQELVETVQQGEQAIVLLNRRGYSTFVMCRDCGHTITCPNCAVALVYHSSSKMLQCHYCGNTAPIPDECPVCHSRRIKFFGTGTEKAETEIRELSAALKPIRMDQDSTAKKFAHEDILRGFITGNYNVLLGTQMVAKGHDIPNVTLVGVLSADSLLNLPDFRAGERTFDLLTQAAGRAGRGAKPGRVVLQVYEADNPIIQAAARQDYTSFAAQELELREAMNYPPYTQLLKLTVHDEDQDKAIALGDEIVALLQHELRERQLEQTKVMGPFPAIVPKVMQVYRINIIIKSKEMAQVKELILASHIKTLPRVSFDVDPVSVV